MCLCYLFLFVLIRQFNGSDVDDECFNPRDKKPDQQSAPEYKRLITIHAGKPKGQIRDHLIVAGNVKRLSLSEQELEKASVSYGADIVRYLSNSLTKYINTSDLRHV